MSAPGLPAVRNALAATESAARELLTDVEVPDTWPGEARAIRAQLALALVALGEADVRLAALGRMLA